mmetsp:Transcript_40401/g.108423  ORF Transcript_40401/g.108423 Transcript_40401/m.108423 type:complete len:202 (+) Transcript_40401:239-844(+)
MWTRQLPQRRMRSLQWDSPELQSTGWPQGLLPQLHNYELLCCFYGTTRLSAFRLHYRSTDEDLFLLHEADKQGTQDPSPHPAPAAASSAAAAASGLLLTSEHAIAALQESSLASDVPLLAPCPLRESPSTHTPKKPFGPRQALQPEVKPFVETLQPERPDTILLLLLLLLQLGEGPPSEKAPCWTTAPVSQRPLGVMSVET